jgi:hypothetical protein
MYFRLISVFRRFFEIMDRFITVLIVFFYVFWSKYVENEFLSRKTLNLDFSVTIMVSEYKKKIHTTCRLFFIKKIGVDEKKTYMR